jgi:hypothetical protein
MNFWRVSDGTPWAAIWSPLAACVVAGPVQKRDPAAALQ